MPPDAGSRDIAAGGVPALVKKVVFEVVPTSFLEELVPRRPEAWVWRYCTPSMLLLSMCLLPFPFLEVSCTTQAGELTIMSQSGIQAMYGGYSTSALANASAARGGRPDMFNGARPPIPAQEEISVWPSLVMVVVPFFFLLAVAIALTLRLCWQRSVLLGGTLTFAIMLIFGQMIWGFPLENSLRDSINKNVSQQQNMQLNNQFGPGMDMAALAATLIHCRFTVWFYLWLLLILASMVPIVIETVVMVAMKVHAMQARQEEEYPALRSTG
jgi:hypothetical protein